MRKLILLCLLGTAFGQTRHTVPNLDTDNTFTGKNQFTKGAVLGPVAFANLGSLGAPQSGTVAIISDGSPGLVCAGGGTGIIAVYLNGAWNCSVSSGSAASFSSPPPLGNTTPNTVAGTVVNIVGSGLFFSAQPTCLFGESDNTLDEFEDVNGVPMWLPEGSLGACLQFLTYTPLPVGVNPTDKQIPAWNAATGAFTIQDPIISASDGSFGSRETGAASACESSFAATTLATGATTTDTGLNCLPINAVIDSVVYRITTTITTAANFTIGDPTTAARFCGTQSTLTSGTTGICFVQADQTGAAGPRQTAAAKVRVTANVNPGAGAIRLIVYYHTWTAPTS